MRMIVPTCSPRSAAVRRPGTRPRTGSRKKRSIRDRIATGSSFSALKARECERVESRPGASPRRALAARRVHAPLIMGVDFNPAEPALFLVLA